MRLEGKSAIITGGGSGIGLACAKRFSIEGAAVAIFGRRTNKLELATKDIEGQILPITGDLTNNNDLDNLVSKTLHAFGKLISL